MLHRVREWCASILKRLLLLGAPLLLSMVMLIVLVVIYVLRPYSLTRDFARTTCHVQSYVVLNDTSASCSAGTDRFQPCVKVVVEYATGPNKSFQSGVIMENEQTLLNCDRCSYTFGRYGLLLQYQEPCGSWKEDFGPLRCVEDFVSKYAVVGSTSACFFDPDNPENIVRDLTLNMYMLIHTLSWPVLLCLAYLLAWAFVCYNSKQCSLLEYYIVEELLYQRERRKMAQIQVDKWKKCKLGHTLGVRNEGFGVSHVGDLNHGSKYRSTSLPSLCKLSEGEVHISILDLSRSTGSIQDLPFDEANDQHLDLAVSHQNISDLTSTYNFCDVSAIASHLHLAQEDTEAFARTVCSVGAEYVLNGMNETVVSEDDIDHYYSIPNSSTRLQESWKCSEGLQIVNMFSATDESKV